MPKIPLPWFFNRSADETALPAGVGARLVDGYVDIVDRRKSIRKRFGHSEFIDTGMKVKIDGLHWWTDQQIAVFTAGGQIFKITASDGTYEEITGDPLSVASHTKFDHNADYLFMASGGKLVYYNPASVATAVLTTGSGLDDATSGGTYTGVSRAKYLVQIDATGTPDTFKWSDDNGSSWTSGVSITGAAQSLSNGVTITFAATTGHTLADEWSFWAGATIEVEDSDAPEIATHVVYTDQYFLSAGTGEAPFQWCDVNDPTSWNALNFATPESKSDTIQAMHVAWREITLFGDKTIEIWFNDGFAPWSRLEGAMIERGCIAANTVVDAAGTWYWLDDERRVSTLSGRQLGIVSTPYDDEIRDIDSVTDAFANFISYGSHAFYVLTFPSVDRTYVYDITTQMWHEWGAWDKEAAEYKAWAGRSYTYATQWQIHLIGDQSPTGKIYKLDHELFQDDGAEIRSLVRTGKESHGTYLRKTAYQLIFNVKRGVGGEAGDEPVFMVRWRDDGGPWSHNRNLSLGKIGEGWMFRVLDRMGQYRTRQYEITHTDNSDFAFNDLEEIVTLEDRNVEKSELRGSRDTRTARRGRDV